MSFWGNTLRKNYVPFVYSLIESNKLPHYRCPGIRVSEEQIAAYLERSKSQSKSASVPKPRQSRQRLKHIRL